VAGLGFIEDNTKKALKRSTSRILGFRLDSSSYKETPTAGSYEHNNEPLGVTKS
jgi:hypothetical protein